MRRSLLSIGAFLVVCAFLYGIFWTIVRLQGPSPKPQPTEAAKPEPKIEDSMSAKTMTETQPVDISLSSGSDTMKLGPVPLLTCEKNAAGEIVKTQVNTEALKKLIAELKDPETATAPVPAEIQKEGNNPRKIKRGKSQLVLDRDKTAENLLAAVQQAKPGQAVTVPMARKADEGPQGFESLRESLGFKHCITQSDTIHKDHLDDAGRNENLRIAALHVDGYILKPGEEFSFNRIVGDRSRKNGFQTAGVISNGKVVPGLGGGVCQVSTTIYNSALMANLQIVERYNHSIYEGIPYAIRGRDAAVVWGAKDFRFKNTLPMPILISCLSGPGTVHVAFYTQEKPPYDKVEIVTENEKKLSYPTQQVKKGKGKSGEPKVIRPGVTGYTIESFRIVTIGSETTRTRLFKDHYQMFPQIEEVSN